jgi:outer membrane protein assembly factor BamB
MAKDMKVGVNPRTGEPIKMPASPKRPLLPIGGFNPYYVSAEFESRVSQNLQKLAENNAEGLDKLMANVAKAQSAGEDALGQLTLLGRRKQVPPARYAECLGKAMDALLTAGKLDSKLYHTLFCLARKYGEPSKEMLDKHARAVKTWMFPDGKLDFARCHLNLCDVIWDTDVLEKAEKRLIEARHLSRAGLGIATGCNNGRWGWVAYANVAAVFANEDLMRVVLEDLQHWLGHDIYPDGGNHDNVSYAYCHSSRPATFDAVASYLEGFDPKAFLAPSMPDPCSTNRDGFEDTSLRDLRSAQGVAWRSIDSWNRWVPDRSAPDGSLFARGDTNPDGVSLPGKPKNYESSVPVLSTNLTSLMVLRGGGPAEEHEQGLRDAPKGQQDREPMIYACLDGAATDPCHNHVNMLQLLVWGKGAWLADDNGCRTNWLTGTYDRELGTYSYKTYAHNTVTVDQSPQYTTNSTQIFFGSQPGFRIAAMDGGHVYDGVSHQRTVAMTDGYLLDMNLLPARSDSPADAVHTFDYMFQGTGQFDQKATKFIAPFSEDRRHVDMNGKGIREYLQWPNLTLIYPYINWATPGKTAGHWDVTYGLKEGPSMRLVVLNDKPMDVAWGMAQLGIRGASTFDTLVLGVPKILARYTGRSAGFLTLMEPFKDASKLAAYAKLDDQAVRVELADGTKDFLLLQRQSPAYVFLRTREGRLVSARFFEGSGLSVGGKALLKASAPLRAAGVTFRDGKVYLAATAEKACSLAVACEGQVEAAGNVSKDAAGFTVALQPGDSRLTVSGQGLAGVPLDDNSLGKLHTDIPPQPAKEVDPYYKLARAKLLWQENYLWPVIYHDGAYKGQKGADSHWSVDVTDDGKVVAGTHFNTVECFDVSGRKLWVYLADGRCSWNNQWAAWRLQRPLHISPDGSRVIAGSEFGTVHFLDGDGRYLWRKKLGTRVFDICPDSAWNRFAVALEKAIVVLDKDGNALAAVETPGMVYEVRMADDGSFAARFDRKVEADPAIAKLVVGDTSGIATVVALFDPTGKERWFAASPGTIQVSGAAAEAASSAPLNGHGFAAFDMTPDGKRVAAASTNTRQYAFDSRNGKMLWESDLTDTVPAGVRLSADANTVYAYGMGGVALCYDGKGKQLWRYRTAFGGYCMDITPDGRRLCAPNATGDVTVLARDKTVVTRSPVHTVEPMGVGISPNGKYFAVGGVGYDLLLFQNPD